MFTKLVKYDLMFSKNTFLTLAAIMIVWGGVVRVGSESPGMWLHTISLVMNLSFMISVLIIGVVSIMQIFRFYRKSMFGPNGYLAFTLPVTRASLLGSKIVVAMIWYMFMMCAAFVMFRIINGGSLFNIHMPTLIEEGLEAAFTGLFLISLLFFVITLAHSSFSNIRVHGVVAGVIGFAGFVLYMWAQNIIRQRWMGGFFYAEGLGAGRIVTAQWRFIDIYAHGLTLVFTSVVVAATLYLLKHRIELR